MSAYLHLNLCCFRVSELKMYLFLPIDYHVNFSQYLSVFVTFQIILKSFSGGTVFPGCFCVSLKTYYNAGHS